MKQFIKKMAGSGFFTGYIPLAPGTFGSLLALIIYFIPGFQNYIVILPAIIIFLITGIYLGNFFESMYGKDPKQFTLDEIVGTWISLLMLPDSIAWILATFVLWRILDIYKPFPANRMESLKGGYGIMLDDVVSAMYSLIIIYIFNILFY